MLHVLHVLHVLRVGCPCRDTHEHHGEWGSVYVRIRRRAEQGACDAMPTALVHLGLTDDW